MIAFITGSLLFWILPDFSGLSDRFQLWQILVLISVYFSIIFSFKYIVRFRILQNAFCLQYFSKRCQTFHQNKVLLLLILFMAGLSYPDFQFQHQKQLITQLKHIILPIDVIGEIDQVKSEAHFTSFHLRLIKLQDLNVKASHSNFLKVNWYKTDRKINKGEIWKFSLKIKPIHGLANPFGFDYERWAWSNHIIGSAYVYHNKAHKLYDADLLFFERWFQQLRFKLLIAIQSHNLKYGHVLKTLLLGIKSPNSYKSFDILRKAGLAHLLAISGLHIGMVFMFSFFIVSLLWRQSSQLCEMIPAPHAARFFGLFFALLYLGISGMNLPAIRAFVMLCLYCFSLWSKINLTFFNIVLITLCLFILVDPMVLLSSSLWLSFGAILVVNIALASFNQSHSIKRQVMTWMQFHMRVWLGLLPLTVGLFYAFAGSGFIANMVAIPLMTFIIMPALFLGAIFSFISPGISLLFWTADDFFIKFLLMMAQFLSQFNLSILLNTSQIILMALLVVLYLAPFYIRIKLLTVMILLALMLDKINTDSNPRGYQLIVFDVGQGQSVLFEYPDVKGSMHQLLIDTGASHHKFYFGQYSWLPYFQKQRIKNIDDVVISHRDNDHSGGLPLLTQSLNINRLYSSYDMGDKPATKCQKGNSIVNELDHNHLSIKFLSPDEPLYGFKGIASNNLSCVVSIEFKNHRVLIPGDIEKLIENRLVMQKQLKKVEVLVAPHHGSLTSSTTEFVKSLAPKYVVFSSGYRNRFNFPRPAIISRYLQQDSTLMNTAWKGAIICRWSPKAKFEGCTSLRNYYWGKWHWNDKHS